jgi:hypothetical protein
MDLAVLARTPVIDRLVKLETEAAHASALADVAAAYAHVARQKADAACPRSRSGLRCWPERN